MADLSGQPLMDEEADKLVDAVVEKLRSKAHIGRIASCSELAGSGERAALQPDSYDHLVQEQQFGSKENRKQFIQVHVLGGRGFTNEVLQEDVGEVTSYFTLHCQFAGQRLTAPRVLCSTDPKFNHEFIFTVPWLEHEKIPNLRGPFYGSHGCPQANFPEHDQAVCSSSDLLDQQELVHFILIRTTPRDSTLQSSCHMTWRNVLTSKTGYHRSFLELNGVYSECSLPIGILEVEIQLMPNLSSSTSEQVLSSQLDYERNRHIESDRLLMNYAKQWWKDFLGIRSSHTNRNVKLFAKDENGDCHMVCSLLHPLIADRVINTPREAARFVSLFPFSPTPWIDSSNQHVSCWTSLLAFLSRGHGGCEEHAILLCCLLLGFGLNAYVCIGKQVSKEDHVWVMTLDDDDTRQVTFWESLSGQRYSHVAGAKPDAAVDYIYSTIGCVFNQRACYANLQPSNKVADCSFLLADNRLWKAVSESAIRSVTLSHHRTLANRLPPIRPFVLSAHLVSNGIEHELRLAVQAHRKKQGLACCWDHNLSFLLTPALAAYESERCSGASVGNEEFQMAIRHYVKDGITFKAFPIQFAHTNPSRMFETCLRSPVFQDIIKCDGGDEIRYSLRVFTTVYPEDLCAVWLMLAVQYRSVL